MTPSKLGAFTLGLVIAITAALYFTGHQNAAIAVFLTAALIGVVVGYIYMALTIEPMVDDRFFNKFKIELNARSVYGRGRKLHLS